MELTPSKRRSELGSSSQQFTLAGRTPFGTHPGTGKGVSKSVVYCLFRPVDHRTMAEYREEESSNAAATRTVTFLGTDPDDVHKYKADLKAAINAVTREKQYESSGIPGFGLGKVSAKTIQEATSEILADLSQKYQSCDLKIVDEDTFAGILKYGTWTIKKDPSDGVFVCVTSNASLFGGLLESARSALTPTAMPTASQKVDKLGYISKLYTNPDRTERSKQTLDRAGQAIRNAATSNAWPDTDTVKSILREFPDTLAVSVNPGAFEALPNMHMISGYDYEGKPMSLPSASTIAPTSDLSTAVSKQPSGDPTNTEQGGTIMGSTWRGSTGAVEATRGKIYTSSDAGSGDDDWVDW
ncbi:hypothetical protein IAU59_004611 [Kwoniella sp. CBS 9459]